MVLWVRHDNFHVPQESHSGREILAFLSEHTSTKSEAGHFGYSPRALEPALVNPRTKTMRKNPLQNDGYMERTLYLNAVCIARFTSISFDRS